MCNIFMKMFGFNKLKKTLKSLSIKFYKWERLFVMLLRGKFFLKIGKFVRNNGALSVIVFLSLSVGISNIYAKTRENTLLKGYWNDQNKKEHKIIASGADNGDNGLVLGDDALVSDNQQIVASEVLDSKKQDVNTDLSLSKDDSDLLFAEADLKNTEYQGSDFTEGDQNMGDTKIYTVKQGDTVESIARANKLTVDTLLWANEIKNPDEIKPGDTIILLSVSGVQHKVKKDDTIDKIAKEYKADKKDIIVFNNLPANGELKEGETITIPGGIKQKPKPKPKPKQRPSIFQRRTYSSTVARVAKTVRSGYYARPIKGGVRTQGIHRTNAVDLAAPIGTPIYAAAPGKVIVAKYGWNGGYGNYVIIQHANGTKTLYAHMRAGGLRVKRGQQVKRGQLIGRMGSTGHSTGPHVHFEVRGAKNPF